MLVLDKRLNDDFALKDTGILHYFFRMKLNPTSIGSLLLKYSKYAKNLFTKAGMVDTKPSTTSMSSIVKLSLNDENAYYNNLSHYRSIVGA